MARHFLAVALLFCLYTVGTYGQCYYPNGDQSNGDVPCDPDAEHSACCDGNPGWDCLTNKLCQSPDGNTIRGSCTDQTFESSDCPRFCLSADRGGHDLISCANETNGDGLYCCDGTNNCCNTGAGRFRILPPEEETWATWNAASTEYVVVSSRPTSLSETPTATPSSSDASETGEPSAETSAESESDEDDDLEEEGDQDEETSSGLSTGAQAGIGVGAGVGALLVGAVAFLLWKLHKSKQAKKEEVQPQAQWYHPGDGQQQYPTHTKTAPEYYYPPQMNVHQTPQEMDGGPRQLQTSAAELHGSAR